MPPRAVAARLRSDIEMIEELTLDDQTLGTLQELRETLRRRVTELRAEAGMLALDYANWQHEPVPDPPSVDGRRHISAYRVLRERVDISLELLQLAEQLEQVDAAIARRPPPEPRLAPAPMVERSVVRSAPPMLRPRPPLQTREAPDARKVVIGVAVALVLLALALVAIARSNDRDDGTVEVLPPSQVVSTPINWRDTAKPPAARKGPCIWRPALRIADGASRRGQTAVVLLTGPDFADEPKREVKVNKNGIATFRVDLKNCSQIARNDAALVSVDGNLNVSPAPPG